MPLFNKLGSLYIMQPVSAPLLANAARAALAGACRHAHWPHLSLTFRATALRFGLTLASPSAAHPVAMPHSR